jgi:hypothetical protein
MVSWLTSGRWCRIRHCRYYVARTPPGNGGRLQNYSTYTVWVEGPVLFGIDYTLGWHCEG